MNTKDPIPPCITARKPTFRYKSSEDKDSTGRLKVGIWAYFIFLVFEGALRKWFLPEFAAPLLIIRDPIALWLVLEAWRRSLLPSNMYLFGMFLIGAVGLFIAVFVGHGNLVVALFGGRILLLHFPLIFVIGRIFKRSDVVQMGKVLVWMAIPMVVLTAVQFYSPQSAWINRGVGGDLEGAGFDGALGFFRPPGTFSFTNGNALFFGFVALFVLYFWLDRRNISNLLLIAASIALVFALPLSISRTLFFHLVLSFMFALLAILRNSQYMGRLLIVAVSGIVIVVTISQFSLFETASTAFSTRFEHANKAEGGFEGVLLDRFLGGLIGAITHSENLPFWGFGLGLGTNVGSMLLVGTRAFLVAEEEWGRIIGELGILLGMGVIILRLGLTVKIAVACFKKLTEGDLLPWMLLSFGALNLAQAQWGQPTALGFSILSAGLMIASLRGTPREI